MADPLDEAFESTLETPMADPLDQSFEDSPEKSPEAFEVDTSDMSPPVFQTCTMADHDDEDPTPPELAATPEYVPENSTNGTAYDSYSDSALSDSSNGYLSDGSDVSSMVFSLAGLSDISLHPTRHA